MSPRGIETENQNEQNGGFDPRQVNCQGWQVPPQKGSNLARLGQKLKRWYASNAYVNFIPDIHLMIDDDRSGER